MILLVPLRRQRSRTPAYLRGPGEVRDCCPTPAREDQVGSGGAGVRATGDARAAISYPRGPRTNLVIEAGYRCAICKETSGLTIDHIVEWAKVRKHEFTNMIVLCAVCHARKTNTSDPRHINRAGLDRYKSKLMMLNSRYSDLRAPHHRGIPGKACHRSTGPTFDLHPRTTEFAREVPYPRWPCAVSRH